MLMMNPFLDYINEILLEEGTDDTTCMQQVNDVSYQAIFSGFNEILGEHLPPNSCVHSTCNDDDLPPDSCVHSICDDDAHPPHQRIYEKEAAEQHVKVVNPSHGLIHKPRNLGASGISLPANGHSSQQRRAEVGLTLNSHSHVMASHTPLKSTQIIPDLHDMKKGMYNSGSCLNSYGLNEARVSLSSDYDTVAHNYHNAINSNDDVMVPYWGKDAVVEGLRGHRCMQAQEQGNDSFKLPSTDEEFCLKLAEVDLSFEDLKLSDVYTDLYVGQLSSSASSTGPARDNKHNGDKKKSLAGKGSKTGKKSRLEVHAFVDVREVLVSCAQAVEIGDARRTNEILQELRQVHGASANGTSLQRTAHFFSKALAARIRGIGEHQFRAMSHKMPSVVTLLDATNVAYELIPSLKLAHYFANQSILKAAEGASRLHIVDYGLRYGIQWPCLISALADRKGGPPLLVITGIEPPQPGVNPAKRLEESGRRLAAYAKTYNVPFQYHAIVSNKLDDLDVASCNLQKAEVLVVNCIKCLRHLADESVDLALTSSPRQKLLNFMRSLNPHLLLTAVTNAAYNSPFFVSRFRQALYHFSNMFDMLETIWGDNPQRLLVERSCFYRDILNIVGCEGAERVERPETYKQWHTRITKAGFEQLPIPPTVVSRSRSHVEQHHHKDFLIHDDGKGWMLMGWKGQAGLAVSAWKPSLG